MKHTVLNNCLNYSNGWSSVSFFNISRLFGLLWLACLYFLLDLKHYMYKPAPLEAWRVEFVLSLAATVSFMLKLTVHVHTAEAHNQLSEQNTTCNQHYWMQSQSLFSHLKLSSSQLQAPHAHPSTNRFLIETQSCPPHINLFTLHTCWLDSCSCITKKHICDLIGM